MAERWVCSVAEGVVAGEEDSLPPQAVSNRTAAIVVTTVRDEVCMTDMETSGK